MIKVCEEMQQFRKMLDEKGIKWEDCSEEMKIHEDWPIWICRTHFEYNHINWSVVNGYATYGGWYGTINLAENEEKNLGLLEIWNKISDPIGWLLAKEAYNIIFGE